MVMAYILFSFSLAGVSAFAFFVFGESSWRPMAARKTEGNISTDQFTSVEGVDSEAVTPERLRADATEHGDGLERVVPLLSLYDETEFKGTAEELQWSDCTLRELEARLTRDAPTLDSEDWKREI